MNIQVLFSQAFGELLPISGGMGNIKEQAVIIQYDGMLNDYSNTEYRVLTLLGIGRQIQWRVIKQEILVEEAKIYDRFALLVEGLPENPYPRQVEYVYFDITLVYNK